MGIKGLYGYCLREVKESYQTVSILEEIAKYQRYISFVCGNFLEIEIHRLLSSVNGKGPLIIINLSTLSYHFKLKPKDLLCGYQLNKIKFDLEHFLAQLKDAGADLEFVFKKTLSDEEDFITRRLRDYKSGCQLIKTISKQSDFETLLKNYKGFGSFPYNTLILVAIIQSAKKFGQIHGCNSLKGKPTVQQLSLAKEKDAAFLMGLDTYYFILPGSWKIWCDAEFDMEAMTIQQLDPNIVMKHFELNAEQAPLFASLIGDLRSSHRNNDKVLNHFGTKARFPNAAMFLRRLEQSPIDEMLYSACTKIFGNKMNPSVIYDFKKTIKSFEIDENATAKIDSVVLDYVKNDFVSIAEEILLNMPIFISPSFLDMKMKDMEPFNDLVMPLIQKTSGILLKNLEDKKPRTVLLLSKDEEFEETEIDVIFPDFDIPPLECILACNVSTIEKMKMLFWVTDTELSDFEIPAFPQDFIADAIILLYLMKHHSLTLFDSRCILKTLVDARRRDIPLECSTEYPTEINERAFRCGFLYSKMYFMMHSCLSSIGMKNLCPEIHFDGVYFQKIYALNKEDCVNMKNTNGTEETNIANGENIPKDESVAEDITKDQSIEFEDLSQTEIIDEFLKIIRD